MTEIQYGLCHCGCGEKTKLAKCSDKRNGNVIGEPVRFISGHRSRLNVRSFEEKMKERVRVGNPDECWEWVGGKTAMGYGVVVSNKIHCYAHRLAYSIHKGEIPNGAEVCHRCDNPSCCNPEHLFLGTHADNMSDMSVKGRTGKLSIEDVVEIRRRASSGETRKSISGDYGVTPENICQIVLRRTWKGIP